MPLETKKLAFLTLITLAIVFATNSYAAETTDDPCPGITGQSIEKHMPIKGYTIVSKTAVHPQICQVVVNYDGTYIPMYVHNDFVLIGDYFSNGSHPTVQAIEAEHTKNFKKDKDVLDKAVAFTYKPKNAKKYLYFITDPDCPACNQAKKSIKEFADENAVEVKVIFYPMKMHPNAKGKATAAICASMTYQDYLQEKYTTAHCKKGDEKIRKSMEIVDKMGIEGTPTFISPTGRKVLGYDANEIKDIL